MATMRDVCLKAGVSMTTVSRVLNGKGRISQETRDQVFKAIEELGYRPNVLAQSLSNQKTNTLGLVIPRGSNISQYISALIEVSQELANKVGKFLMITQVDSNDINCGIESIKNLVDRRCDGILFYKSSHVQDDKFQYALENLIDSLPIPLVIINYNLPNKPNNCIWFDHIATARLPVEHLIKLGHRKIAYISGALSLRTARLRLEGYQNALKDAGISLEPLFITEGNGMYNGGYAACNQLIQRNLDFTAICCFNDLTAIGALKSLHDHGITVPDDVSLFGFDNDAVLDYTIPPLSSVALPVHSIVEQAMDLLVAHIDDLDLSKLSAVNKNLSAVLVERSSIKQL